MSCFHCPSVHCVLSAVGGVQSRCLQCFLFVACVCVCVCVCHGCGIYVHVVVRDQYILMCEHVSCCVHVCVQWIMVCCGCMCFWCMWCHVCGYAS